MYKIRLKPVSYTHLEEEENKHFSHKVAQKRITQLRQLLIFSVPACYKTVNISKLGIFNVFKN